ncbi:hypothetical protein [Yokenella regensburgei]|uniref:hypothetical protein n=1 Tax=Yokenella regensburgei TaxID=158877 RepID=UPI0013759B9A|nr:hypothetical protein [Yokenella regensburgei]KAF1366280.1 hypothetical protein FHR25_005248 [Yokenella regensburgei]
MRNTPCKTELKVARSQRNRLRTIAKNLTEMSCEWDGLSGWLETESERLAEQVEQHLVALEEQIREWADGMGDQKDE